MKISSDLIPLAYSTSKQVFDGHITLEEGIERICNHNRMNKNSARDYIYNFKYLKTGKKFSRTLNYDSMLYYFEHLVLDYGVSNLNNPLRALQSHIEYYESYQGTTMHAMREILAQYSKLIVLPQLVTTKDELIKNIETFENYIVVGSENEKEEAFQLLLDGIDFIAYSTSSEIRFVSSKFVGYQDNRFFRFSKTQMDGRLTSPQISKLLGSKPSANKVLEQAYSQYCSKLGILSIRSEGTAGNERKFWSLNLPTDFQGNNDTEEGFPEGKMVERIHKSRERNQALVNRAKELFIQKNEKLYCEVCKTDFEEKYGEIGRNYIEAHHTIPVSEMPLNYKTKVEEIAMLCSNCHRMVHKKRPWLSINQLKDILSLHS